MSIRCVTAKLECDGCGKIFEVRLDPAEKSIADTIDTEIGTYFDLSVQHLCTSCTRKVDSLGDEDYQPTRDEILGVLAP